MTTRVSALFLLILVALAGFAAPASAQGIAMYGTPKYSGDFHFSYVNPNAPKGGTLRLHALGTFDSLNPFILKGVPAPGLNALGQGYVFDSLMVQSEDEPFSVYPLIATSLQIAPDKRGVTFALNPKARFQDGTPITARDVVWTFNALMTHGSPFFKAYFGDVTDAKAVDTHTATFVFANADNRELPLILAQLPVLSQAYWTAPGRDFAKTTLEAPMGSGPYRIARAEAGKTILFERVKDYWAADLPVNRGRYNFDRISVDLYKDSNVALEAFFADQYDLRDENVAKLWATGYDTPPLTDGRIRKEAIPNERPQGMQAFVFNIRRPVFADRTVRQALNYAFDYEWSNKQFAYGTYTRTDSFFENTDLASSGTPSKDERILLEPFRSQLPTDLFTKPYTNPVTDGSGNIRANLREAAQLLEEAGYRLGPDGVRVNAAGVRLSFEIIDNNPMLERWILPFIANMKKIGVEARYRLVDPAQYQNRIQNFDFDMTSSVIGQSQAPGNEQRDLWHSSKASVPGSRNIIGINHPAVDSLVEAIITARTLPELQTATRALDRVLLFNHYVIPQWHYGKFRIAWWDRFGRPETPSPLSLGVSETWWAKPTE